MKNVCYIIITIMLVGCGNIRTYTEQDNQAFQNLKDMVTAKNFEIKSHIARPNATSTFTQVANSTILGPGNTASNIDISGNSNKLTIKGDSISGYFPYFGEQQFGSGYPGINHQGIEFMERPDDYNVMFNDQKHKVIISFDIDDQYRNNEHYSVIITLFPNYRSSIQINSSNRSTIEYSGSAKLIQEDKTMVQN